MRLQAAGNDFWIEKWYQIFKVYSRSDLDPLYIRDSVHTPVYLNKELENTKKKKKKLGVYPTKNLHSQIWLVISYYFVSKVISYITGYFTALLL